MSTQPNFAFFPLAGWEGLPRQRRPRDGKLCVAKPSFWAGSFTEDRHGLQHGGSDIVAPIATQILYPAGVPGVAWANLKLGDIQTDFTYWAGGGNHAYILSDDGYLYYFAHMQQRALIRPGDRVRPGQWIGLVGSSGNVTASCAHLHLQMYPFRNGIKGRAIDPYPYLVATWPEAQAKKKVMISLGVIALAIAVGWGIAKIIKNRQAR